MVARQLLSESLAAPVNVRLHLAHGDAEGDRNLLVAHALEVEEHERHALVIGKPSKRSLEMLAFVRALEIRLERTTGRERAFVGSVGVLAGRRDLAEEPPSRAVAGEMVEAGVPR